MIDTDTTLNLTSPGTSTNKNATAKSETPTLCLKDQNRSFQSSWKTKLSWLESGMGRRRREVEAVHFFGKLKETEAEKVKGRLPTPIKH